MRLRARRAKFSAGLGLTPHDRARLDAYLAGTTTATPQRPEPSPEPARKRGRRA